MAACRRSIRWRTQCAFAQRPLPVCRQSTLCMPTSATPPAWKLRAGRRDEDGEFPREFHKAMAEAGWLGITMPPEYGGAGLGVSEAAIMMHEVASHGGGMAATSTVHINLFGPHPIVVVGSDDQKKRWLPRLVEGKDQCCFGFTEPDAGLNTTAIKTFAQKVSGGYIVHGQKVWTSTAQIANKIMLLTRSTKLR